MAFKLPRLPTGWEDQDQLFERYWDELCLQLEATINSILELPTIKADIIAAQAAADAAQTTADAAASSAGTAGSDATETKEEQSIVLSYVTGFTAPLITADSTGEVIIANHTRKYGHSDINPDKTVTGATITSGASAGDTLRFYYDDASRAGGSVTYAFTTDPAAFPVQSGDRHSVGAVTIPVSGGQDGDYVKPPGYVNLN